MLMMNQLIEYGSGLDPADREAFAPEVPAVVRSYLSTLANGAATPLLALPALARQLSLADLCVKDEGQRMGLGSFKALGGTHAVVRCLLAEAAARLGRPVGAPELINAEIRRIAGTMTMTCATDGNHGLAVAAAARAVGAAAVIFVHAGVSAARVQAMAAQGAAVTRVSGSYDDAVAEAQAASEQRRWTLVADTSWPGYERVPLLVMQGYTVVVHEALEQMAAPPTHVFLQAGVGGLAAAVAAHLQAVLGPARPRLLVVEPQRAACLYRSAAVGSRLRIAAGEATLMAMLECYEPSLIAWRILARTADGFVTLEEAEAVAAMRRMACPLPGDPILVSGASGAAGLAGLLQVATDRDARQALALDAAARVLILSTEGATDPQRYRALLDGAGAHG